MECIEVRKLESYRVLALGMQGGDSITHCAKNIGKAFWLVGHFHRMLVMIKQARAVGLRVFIALEKQSSENE